MQGVNKLLAMLLLLGALGALGLSQMDRFETYTSGKSGAPSDLHVHAVTHNEKLAYLAISLVCLVTGLYFVARIRRDDVRK